METGVGEECRKSRRKRPKLDGTLAAVLANPLRCKIHTVLHQRVTSPSEFSAAFGQPIDIVSAHFRNLAELDLIEIVGERNVRGSTEHFYRALVRPEISDEEFAMLTADERQAIAREILQLLCADAGSSIYAGTFGSRADNYIVRQEGFVDEEGWQELGTVFDVAKEGIDDVVAAVIERRAADATIPAFSVTTALTFFETPLFKAPDFVEAPSEPVSPATPLKQPQLDECLVAVLTHPVRCRIVTILHGRVASPKEIAAVLNMKVSAVSYHVRHLDKIGAIELVARRRRRAAMEHLYRAVVRPELTNEEFAKLTSDEREAVAREVFLLLYTDAASSLDAGIFGARADNYIVRHPIFVDEPGWQELGIVFGDANAGIDRALAASLARRAVKPTIPDISITAGLAFFESPVYKLPHSDRSWPSSASEPRPPLDAPSTAT